MATKMAPAAAAVRRGDDRAMLDLCKTSRLSMTSSMKRARENFGFPNPDFGAT